MSANANVMLLYATLCNIQRDLAGALPSPRELAAARDGIELAMQHIRATTKQTIGGIDVLYRNREGVELVKRQIIFDGLPCDPRVYEIEIGQRLAVWFKERSDE